jgi:hypothetical protein
MTTEASKPLPPALPAPVSGELRTACVDADNIPVTHRVWVLRDGTVRVPDHATSEDAVLAALGGRLVHPCAYWSGTGSMNPSAGAAVPDPQDFPPELASWTLVPGPSPWTSRAMWTVTSALVGRPTFTVIDPMEGVALTQAFASAGVRPANLETHLELLRVPAQRAAGFRRERPTGSVEVAAYLSAGVPAHLVSAAAALDFSANQARRGVQEAARLRVPFDVVIRVADAVPVGEALRMLAEHSPATVHTVHGQLAQLGNTRRLGAS